MKILKEENFIKTTDFLTCNVLLHFGHTLEAVNREDPSRCVFVIKRESNTDEIIDKFYRGELLVEPKLFQAISKEIKSRLYN